jgi:hypothetical protein
VTWKAFTGGLDSVPILAGGNIVTVITDVSSGLGSITLSVMTPAGVDSQYASTLIDGPQSVSNLITDGINIYVAYRDIYPRDWFSYWDLATYTFNANLIGSVYYNNGLVLTASNKAVVIGGDHYGSTPSMANYTLPATPISYNNFAYSAPFGHGVLVGGSVWTVLVGTTTLAELDPVGLNIIATYTLPAAAAGYQIGYDGAYLYIAAAGTGIIVWDIGSSSGAVFGSGTYENAYYSANQSQVFTHDSSDNIYTMPAGGGSLTNVGNTLAITGVAGQNVNGFCDGPAGNDLWANCYNNPQAFNIVYTPGGMRIAMAP